MWVAEPSRREDLCTLVLAYLQGSVPHPPIDNAVNFYQAAKTAAVSFCGNATILEDTCMRAALSSVARCHQKAPCLACQTACCCIQGHFDTACAMPQIEVCYTNGMLSLHVTEAYCAPAPPPPFTHSPSPTPLPPPQGFSFMFLMQYQLPWHLWYNSALDQSGAHQRSTPSTCCSPACV